MATLHFVKDGKLANGERITKSAELPMAAAVEKLSRFETRRSESGPTINPEVAASEWAPYKHVVLEVPSGEQAAPFSEPGFYYLIGLSPADCEALLGLRAPSA
jgi:hypothetical protein